MKPPSTIGVRRWRRSIGASLGLLTAVALHGADVPAAPPASEALPEALAVHARAVLHQIMVSEQSWVRIHAAEALMEAGETEAIRTYFLNELPNTESSAFRIGVWRVLATASHTPEERAKWIAKVERVYLDPTAPDQNQAIETLNKLGYRVSGEALEKIRHNAAGLPSAPMALALWSGTLAGEPHALEGLTGLLTSKDPALRTSAAYALRWLHPSDPAVREALVHAAATEAAGTVPYVYILGAALTVEADPAQTANWETKLNEVMLTGTAGARFEASWTLKHRYKFADLPRLAAILDLPASENDARIGAATIILMTLARP